MMFLGASSLYILFTEKNRPAPDCAPLLGDPRSTPAVDPWDSMRHLRDLGPHQTSIVEGLVLHAFYMLFTWFYHVLPCFTMCYHVLPCFTASLVAFRAELSWIDHDDDLKKYVPVMWGFRWRGWKCSSESNLKCLHLLSPSHTFC